MRYKRLQYESITSLGIFVLTSVIPAILVPGPLCKEVHQAFRCGPGRDRRQWMPPASRPQRSDRLRQEDNAGDKNVRQEEYALDVTRYRR